MGENYGIACKRCGYSKEFLVGTGLLYSPENIKNIDDVSAVLPMFIKSKRTLDEIRTLFREKEAVVNNGYSIRIYRCPKCGEFHRGFHFSLSSTVGYYEIEYLCPECYVGLELIGKEVIKDKLYKYGSTLEIDLSEYPCPECGEHLLHRDSISDIIWK